MSIPTAKAIIEWLSERGALTPPDREYGAPTNSLWREHQYAHGSTEQGFTSDYSLDTSRLEAEMDEWIAATFRTTNTPVD